MNQLHQNMLLELNQELSTDKLFHLFLAA